MLNRYLLKVRKNYGDRMKCKKVMTEKPTERALSAPNPRPDRVNKDGHISVTI